MRRRFVLGEDQFRDLVAGRVVVLPGGPPVELILSDIGWSRVRRAVLDGMGREPASLPPATEPENA